MPNLLRQGAWGLLLTTWVAADLLDGDWADALPSLVGWSLTVGVLAREIVRARRKRGPVFICQHFVAMRGTAS
jgi:hypothetical protein